MQCRAIDRNCEEFDLDKVAEDRGYTGKRADVLCICGSVAIVIEETSGKAKKEDVEKLLASLSFLKEKGVLPTYVKLILCVLHHGEGLYKGVAEELRRRDLKRRCKPISANCDHDLMTKLRMAWELSRR